ncbi:MAG TPA: hypothetical protein VMR41_02965 [Patescibacteria group bacterium]|jgi:hypothetical protein|nr:hypothetical protein [Patescibacteria group bacterium]
MEGSEKKKNWFLKHKVITTVLVVFVVLVVLGMIGSKSENNSSTTTTSGTSNSAGNSNQTVQQTAPTVVDATALVAAYDKNKIAAQDQYTGKTVQTTGYISNISDDITGNYYLSLNPSNDQYYMGTSISCYFADKSAKSEITSLQNGQSVTVQGTMADMSIGIVVINDCKVVQ